MSITGAPTRKGDDDEVKSSNVDANTAATTDSISVSSHGIVGLYVAAVSGTHATHITTLQASPDDGVTWFDTSHTITGVGAVFNIICSATDVRAKITTLEGSASVVDVHIVTK